MKPMTQKEQRELIKIFTRLRHINYMLAKLNKTYIVKGRRNVK